MSRRPPLSDLHAFDAVARRLSFTKAAQDLAVTQGAVSQRIKTLEARLGVRLVHRLTRALALTEQGAVLATALRDGFSRIEAGLEALHAPPAAAGLTVAVSSSFAGLWLLPRLAGFQAAHPNIRVEVRAEDRLTGPHLENVDLALRFGAGPPDDWRALDWMDDTVFAVTAPGSAALGLDQPWIRDAAAEDDASGCGWRAWTQAAGESRPVMAGPSFNQAVLALQAAKDGLGVALGRRTLVQADLACGRLVKAHPFEAPARFSHRILFRPDPIKPAAAAFIVWLQAQAAAA